MAMLADVFLDLVENEVVDNPYTVTEKPVEGGQNVVDHVRKDNEQIRLTGILQGEDWQERYNQIKKISDEAVSVSYRGKKFFAPAIVQSITEDYSRRVIDGFPFVITLVKPRFAIRRSEEVQAPDPVTPSPPAGVAATTTQTKPTSPSTPEQPQIVQEQIENLIPTREDGLIGTVAFSVNPINDMFKAAQSEVEKRKQIDVISGQIPIPRGNTALNAIPGGGGR